MSIEDSLASVFQIEHNNFAALITNYYIKNIKKIDEINYNSFIKFLLEKSPFKNIGGLIFDKICIFHKTSTIDTFKTFKKYGLLPLREALKLDTELSVYLRGKDISFDFINDIPFIVFNKQKTKLKRYEGKYSFVSKEHREDRLSYRLTKDYNINGYLYYEGAINDTSYKHIKYISEFLIDLSEYIGQGIEKDWEAVSSPVILKIIVDIENIDMVTDNNIMNKNEITIEIIKISLENILEKLRHFLNGGYSTPIKYVFLKMNQIVSPENIIDYIDY